MPDLSVVIPTYRRPKALRRTLAALAEQTAPAERFEVIVVDDPVEDDSRAVAGVLAGSSRAARLLHREARGVSAARNAGWRAAAAPVVLFLGDDILADAGLVAAHLGFHDRQPEEEAALVGHVRWADELRRTPLMAWLEDGIHSEYGRLNRGEAPGWWDFLTTNVSVKRSLLERAGGFDERNFPFFYEDTDLGLRLERLGMRLRYDPAATAEHLHSPTLAEWRERMAAIARAERRFVELHPDAEAYFEHRLRSALSARRARGRLALALFPLARIGVPNVAPRIRHELDLHYRQELAPAFLRAWEEAASSRG